MKYINKKWILCLLLYLVAFYSVAVTPMTINANGVKISFVTDRTDKTERYVEISTEKGRKLYNFSGHCKGEFFAKKTQDTRDFVVIKHGCGQIDNAMPGKMLDSASFVIYDRKTGELLGDSDLMFSYRDKQAPIDSNSTWEIKVKKVGEWLYQFDKYNNGKDVGRCVIYYKNGESTVEGHLSTSASCLLYSYPELAKKAK